MKYIFYLLFCFILLNASAQETIKVTNSSKKSYYSETYYVLKSNKSIKHGHYQKYNSKNQLMEEGYYKLDKKDSLWTEYSYNGSIKIQGYYKNDKKNGIWTEYDGPFIKSRGIYSSGLKNDLWETFHYNSFSLKNKGSYINDKKSGVWEFYSDVETLIHRYDFDKRKLLYDGTYNVNFPKMEVLTDSGYVKVDVERSPKFIGGDSELMSHLQTNIKYPEIAMDNGIQGTVLVTFIVNEQGIASDFKVEKPLGGGLDQESIRVLELTSDNWIPGSYKGSPVKVKMVVPVRYKLNR